MQNRLFKLLLIFLFSLTTTTGHATANGKQAQAEAAILATLTETLVGALVGKEIGVVAIKGTQLSIQTAKVVVQKTRQTVKFSTDDLGRINKVEGKLDLDIKDRNSHQQNSQLITSMLNGPGGKTKLLSGNLNEDEWRKLGTNGVRVIDFLILLVYPDSRPTKTGKADGSSTTPFSCSSSSTHYSARQLNQKYCWNSGMQ